MKVPVIQIGNSRGIRFSKTILEKYSIRDSVELILEKSQIVIRPLEKPRSGWDNVLREMSKYGDDDLLMDDVFLDETPEEWE